MALRDFQLKYGKGIVSFKIPQEQVLYELEGNNHPALADLQEFYRQTRGKSCGYSQRHHPRMAEK
jgi:hypothetical protein